MKAHHHATGSGTALQLLLAALLSGCGLGTEVGNGTKTEGEKGTNQNASEDPVAEDSMADQEDELDSDGSAISDFAFDFDVLVASCASPFAEDLISPIAMASKEDDGPRHRFEALFDEDDQLWSIKNHEGALMRQVARSPEDGAFAVEAIDGDGTPAGNEFTCSAVQEETGASIDGEDGEFLLRSTVITTDDGDLTLSWYLAGEAAPFSLVRLEVTDGEDETTVLTPAP